TSLLNEHGMFVDQTDLLEKLFTISTGRKVHAAVPRHFSKTTNIQLIIDMCEKNAKDIFAGTQLGRSTFFQTEWNPPYPVLHFNFAEWGGMTSEELERNLLEQILQHFKGFGLKTEGIMSINGELTLLLDNLRRKGKPVVVLIDEYDVPIIGSDARTLKAMHRFYTPLKGHPALTKLIMFGTHNVLDQVGTSTNDTFDLMDQPPFYNMFGFSQKHIEGIFSEQDPNFEAFKPPGFKSSGTSAEKKAWILERLKGHYDGYRFSEHHDAARLYNPW
ncbi:MAG: AAA family ATPase, partial [Actinobacteria bacterium]|nr:AAA family ATPase [Actinomycetota bacterium]